MSRSDFNLFVAINFSNVAQIKRHQSISKLNVRVFINFLFSNCATAEEINEGQTHQPECER